MSWDGTERRNIKRYGVKDSSVQYCRSGLFSFFRNYSDRYLLLNISENGLHFITKDELSTGDGYNFHIQFRSLGYPLRISGRVVWTRKSIEHDAYRTGIQITGISVKSRRVLRHILDNTLLDNVKISTGTYLKEIKRL